MKESCEKPVKKSEGSLEDGVNLGFYRSTIAAGTELEKPESVPTGLKSKSIRKLAGRDVVKRLGFNLLWIPIFLVVVPTFTLRFGVWLLEKMDYHVGSTSFSCFSRVATSNTKGEVDGNSGIKGETDQESVGDVGMQSDNGSLVYYLPGYNPYASGAVVGVDGQSVGQQAYFSSPGYLPHPVFYGSEAMPCYSWDSAYFSDVSNGNTGSQNGKYGSASTFAKSSGFNSMKSNDNTAGKSSKSTNTQAIRPLNKVSALGSDFSAGLSKGYHPVGNLPPFSIQKHGPFPHNCPMNYRQNGRIWNGNDRNKSGDRFYKNSDFETSNELTSGPRGSNKFPSLETAVKEDLGITVQRDQYNKPDFETKYADAKFYVIKSYNEDDIHKSIKYDVWASTPNGNKKLDAAFCEAEQRS
ncbi:hypothetical protein GH714_022633 [Hevea brasiliensis]|uniref:YTH domain-containing family protein n=1 Tax=Hevea brasiliensis TaxID=3981 RepID=A0A6A6N413_HEVBR|nr:hypothetical protein GH714_022633 [Hevea brasiliensis]